MNKPRRKLKGWFKFWIRPGNSNNETKQYKYFDAWVGYEELEDVIEQWAQQFPFYYQAPCTYGYEKIRQPPKAWLDKHLESLKLQQQYTADEISRIKYRVAQNRKPRRSGTTYGRVHGKAR